MALRIGWKWIRDALRSRQPKPRGGFGEKALIDLVAQVLPVKSYQAQFAYKNGSIVDLMIRTTNGMISVDAKFPLENYLKLVEAPQDEAIRKPFRGDVKKHIKDIAKKYILPEEGTLDFALLYVPSDAVMYEILTDGELCDSAEKLHVFILSPHSFYYFLNIIHLAYQSQQGGSDYFLAVSKFLDLSTKTEKENLRVRYWKGEPTKRYARQLRQMRLMGIYSSVAMQVLKKKRLVRKGRKRV